LIGGYVKTFDAIKVEKVENGYLLKPGTSKSVVVEGHGTKRLAEKLAEMFGVETEDGTEEDEAVDAHQ
jgi:hypothetical protein